MKKTFVVLTMMFLLATLLMGCNASQQTGKTAEQPKYPTKDLRGIVTWAPGGSTDLMFRTIASYYEKRLGKKVIVDNIDGAGGLSGWREVAKSPKDGYTIAVVNVPALTNHMLLVKDAGIKLEDFTAIGNVVTDRVVLAVKKDSQFKDLKEFLQYAKDNPGKVKITGSGLNSIRHATYLLMQGKTKTQMKYIAYESDADTRAQLLGGHVDAWVGTEEGVVPYLNNLRPLAVVYESRSPALPDVPTFEEVTGIKLSQASYRGVIVPGGTPPEIVERLRSELKAIVKDPEFIATMTKTKTPVNYIDGPEYEKVWRSMLEDYRKAFTDAGIIK